MRHNTSNKITQMVLCLTLHFNTVLNALSMKTNTGRFNLATLGAFCLVKTLAREVRLSPRGEITGHLLRTWLCQVENKVENLVALSTATQVLKQSKGLQQVSGENHLCFKSTKECFSLIIFVKLHLMKKQSKIKCIML